MKHFFFQKNILSESNHSNNQKEFLLKNIEENIAEFEIACFDSIPMNTQDIERLAKALEKNTHVKILNLSYINLTPDQVQLLKPALEKNRSIILFEIDRFKNDSKETQQTIDQLQKYAERNKQFSEKKAMGEEIKPRKG